jgi:hypothetical protein
LREEHRQVFGKEPVSAHRQFLFRKISWRLQADEEGWALNAVRELARGIARNSPLRNRVITNAGRRRAGLPPGQTGLWIVVRLYAAKGDDWTTGDIQVWGACLQQGNDPQKAYARTWASQAPPITSGLAAGQTMIAAPDAATSPLKIHGPGSNLADSTLLELTANGELLLAGGSG